MTMIIAAVFEMTCHQLCMHHPSRFKVLYRLMPFLMLFSPWESFEHFDKQTDGRKNSIFAPCNMSSWFYVFIALYS